MLTILNCAKRGALPLVLAALVLLSLSAPVLAASTGTSSGQVTVTDYAPTIVSVAFANVTAGTANPTPDGVTTVTATVTCSHLNGWQQLDHIVISLVGPSTTKGPFTDNNPTQLGSNPNQATFTQDFAMQYYDSPGTYTVHLTVYDKQGLNATDTSTYYFTYAQAVGVTVETSSISFGTLNYGAVSAQQTINVHNSANKNMTVNVKADNFAGTLNSIAMGQLNGSATSGGAGQAMTGTYTQLDSLIVPYGANYGIGHPTSTYWVLTMPGSSPPLSGTYTTTIYFQVV